MLSDQFLRMILITLRFSKNAQAIQKAGRAEPRYQARAIREHDVHDDRRDDKANHHLSVGVTRHVTSQNHRTHHLRIIMNTRRGYHGRRTVA